jgi:hypothetical protein
MEVPGDVENDSEITFETPNFEKYGAVGVEGRVAVGGALRSSNAYLYLQIFEY